MKGSNRNKNFQIITVLVFPLLLIILGNLGYAAWTDQISTIARLSNAKYDIEILDCWIQEYNGLGCELTWQVGGKEISFVDNALFSGWHLTLFTKIHNKDSSQSWVAKINYTLYYLDQETQTWIKCSEIELYNLFRINYTGAFYLDAGADGIWDTPDDTPMPPDYQINPCSSVYNRQNLFFDLGDNPEPPIDGAIIKVVITATYPQEEAP